MDIQTIVKDFKKKVCDEIRLMEEGKNRFRVFTPFMLEDGDHLCILLKKGINGWLLSDEGHTYMHLTYDMDQSDLEKGTRRKIIDTSLNMFGIEDNDGELVSKIEEDKYGDALYSFVQGLLRVTDVSYLSRERVKSTFMEDFRIYMTKTVPEEKRVFNYSDPIKDPEKKYIVDCKINGTQRPLFVFAIPNDDKCNTVTITILQYERMKIPFQSLSIFEDQEVINRKVLSRFTDVAERQFSSLHSNEDRIQRLLSEFI